MPKRRIRGLTRKYKWTFSLLVSIGFFALYVIFYKTLEESGSGGPQTDETRFSTAFNVTEVRLNSIWLDLGSYSVFRLFPIRIPPFSTHNVPDYAVPREGPGENGMGVTLTGEEEQRAKLEMKHWFMNTIARFFSLLSPCNYCILKWQNFTWPERPWSKIWRVQKHYIWSFVENVGYYYLHWWVLERVAQV